MNKPIKGILIDPETQTVAEVEIHADENGSQLDSMYETLKCRYVETSSGGLDWLPGGCPDDVWFDEEAMLGEPEYFFQIPGWHSLAGRGLILGHDDECNSVSHTLSEVQIEELRNHIRYFRVTRK